MHKLEWQEIDEQASIRQGDLLIKRNLRTKEVIDRLIVITADCDFAQSKTRGAIAGLRVLSLAEYVHIHWSQKHVGKISTDLTELVNSFNSIISKAGHPNKLSREAVESWVSRQPSSSIAAQLKLFDLKLVAKLNAVCERLRCILDIFNSVEGKARFESICMYYSTKEGKSPGEARELVLNRVRSELGSLPEDVFFLNTLSAEFQSPHVVMLRNLAFIPLDEATSSAEVARELDCYLRFSRLSPTFKYAISQQFGLLYSRIGLPKEYDLSKKLISESFLC
jgi:hypothetical protein